MLELLDAPVAVVLTGIALWLISWRPMSRKLAAAQTHLDEAARLVSSAERQEEARKKELDALESGLDALRRDVEDNYERAMRYFRCIETIERERNEWQAAYEKAVSGHGRAQEMMLGELGRMGRRIEGAQKALEADPPQVERARALLSTRAKDEVLKLPEQYAADHDPETGAGAAIQRSVLDLTEEEVRQRSGAPEAG